MTGGVVSFRSMLTRLNHSCKDWLPVKFGSEYSVALRVAEVVKGFEAWSDDNGLAAFLVTCSKFVWFAVRTGTFDNAPGGPSLLSGAKGHK